MSSQQLQIVVCEPFHPLLHGVTDQSSPDIESHFLVHTTFDAEEFFEGEPDTTIQMLNKAYIYNVPTALTHPTIRNYYQLIGRAGFTTDIAQLVELDGGEEVAILNTYRIRIFQRHVRAFIARRRSEQFTIV